MRGPPLYHEVPSVHCVDAAGLDTTLQRLGTQVGLAAPVVKQGSRRPYQCGFQRLRHGLEDRDKARGALRGTVQGLDGERK